MATNNIVFHKRFIFSLSGAPRLFRFLLSNLPADDPFWDVRSDPERFTLREITAHLADMEPIWRDRIEQAIFEEEPVLPPIDQDVLAGQNKWAFSAPDKNLVRFYLERNELVRLLESMTEQQWERNARRETLGTLNVRDQVVWLITHDLYHLHQIVEWLQRN